MRGSCGRCVGEGGVGGWGWGVEEACRKVGPPPYSTTLADPCSPPPHPPTFSSPLQTEAGRAGWECALHGGGGGGGGKSGSLHLLVRIPSPVVTTPTTATSECGAVVGAEWNGGRGEAVHIERLLSLYVSTPHPTPPSVHAGQPPSQQQQRSSSSSEAAHSFLDTAIARSFSRAGLGAWRVPTGCADPAVPLKIQR
jgi:hypothetical protein